MGFYPPFFSYEAHMAWILSATAIFLLGVYKSRHGVLLQPRLRNIFISCILLLAFAWNVRAHLPNSNIDNLIDLSFHFFGASLLVALFGFWSAITLLFIVALIGVFGVSGDLVEASRHYLLVSIIPALIACGVMKVVQRLLPKHLFILILGNGYLAAFISTFATGLLIYGLQQFFQITSFGSSDPLGWFLGLLVLSFMEGSLSGMLLAILLVYRPQWVSTYQEDRYMNA
ncbi:MAG: energy-coupling factor ABC transporter permease [Polynucleobacter sp.]